MIKEFFVYFGLIIILCLIVNLHYIFFKENIDKDSLSVAKISSITEPSLSVGGFENRFLYLDKNFDNSIYPDMLNIDTMGFVYER